jgi:hypothetical protein
LNLIFQLIESSDLSFCLSTFTTLMRTWCVTTFNDDDDERMTINQYSDERTSYWLDSEKSMMKLNLRIHTDSQMNSQVWICKFCHSQNH